jgi:hypothetical protein
MQEAEVVLSVLRERGRKGLPLTRPNPVAHEA